MLRMSHLSKVYRTEVIETYALRDFSVHVREGEFVAVTGPSGSGKTTFLTIAGLLEDFSSGEYWLDGVDTRGMNDRQRSRLRNEKIGFVFQSFNLIPDLNVFDNIDVPLRYRGMAGAERKRRIHAVLERVGLTSRMRHYPAQMSGGQQQRVAIARALVGEPRLLLADEPTGNLDTHMAHGVMELLEELHRGGATLVMVTHDPELAAHAQRQVHIIDGTIVELSAEGQGAGQGMGKNTEAGAGVGAGAGGEALPGGSPSMRGSFTTSQRMADKLRVYLLPEPLTAQPAPQPGPDGAHDPGDRCRGRCIDDHSDSISRDGCKPHRRPLFAIVRAADRQLGTR